MSSNVTHGHPGREFKVVVESESPFPDGFSCEIGYTGPADEEEADQITIMTGPDKPTIEGNKLYVSGVVPAEAPLGLYTASRFVQRYGHNEKELRPDDFPKMLDLEVTEYEDPSIPWPKIKGVS